MLDAVVVGSGPNGLAAAVTLAEAGRSVLVLEANEQPGGGVRSAELTRPGFVHDLGSAIHPFGVGSPFFRRRPLDCYGLRWVHPGVPLAHPFDDGTAAVLHRGLDATAAGLGADGRAWRQTFGPLAARWRDLADEVLQPVLHVPRHPVLLARFGVQALWPAAAFARARFRGREAQGLWAGLAAHAMLPLEAPASSAIALVLGMLGHAVGWPMPEGGAQALTDALVAYLHDLGGTVKTGARVDHVDDLPAARAVLLDVTPSQLLRLADGRLPAPYAGKLARFRHGMGVYKVDYALDGPIPWTAAACAEAGTVHLGGTLDEVAASERAVAGGRVPERPFVLLAQHTRFDPTRAPEGRHTCWAYCHVPLGSTVDAGERIDAQIERFAPGFRDRILDRCAMGPADLQRTNANLVGGDVNGGAQDLRQVVARPVLSPTPYRTAARGLYLCSASTPPGGGVHGMCGYHAARTVLRDIDGGRL